MYRELTQRLHSNYKKASRVTSYISHLIFLLVIVAGYFLVSWKDWTLLPIWIVCAVFIISFIISTYIFPEYEYRSFSFDVFEEEIEIQSGIWFRSNVLVPMNRVQHVEVGSGPIMRKYHLASLKIVTAAKEHEIKGLNNEEAEILKTRIGELTKVDDQHE